jgi:hypothetical protein
VWFRWLGSCESSDVSCHGWLGWASVAGPGSGAFLVFTSVVLLVFCELGGGGQKQVLTEFGEYWFFFACSYLCRRLSSRVTPAQTRCFGEHMRLDRPRHLCGT